MTNPLAPARTRKVKKLLEELQHSLEEKNITEAKEYARLLVHFLRNHVLAVEVK